MQYYWLKVKQQLKIILPVFIALIGGISVVIANTSADSTKIYMQDLTSSACEQKASNSSLTVYDKRDEKAYTVRYINGACWMTQNLRYVGDTGSPSGFMTIKSATTNIDTDKTLFYTDLTSGNSYDEARIHVGVDNNNDATVWYNYAAASAGTVNTLNSSITAVYDLCPKNWHLPAWGSSSGQIGSVTSYKDVFNPVYGGYYVNGSIREASALGYWWSANYSAYNMHGTLYYGNDKMGASARYNYEGAYIRCVSSAAEDLPDGPATMPTMQDATAESLAAAMPNEGDSTTLQDVRDGNTYQITKINGAYWMTQNLRYVGDAGSTSGSMTIKSATTNVSTDKTLSYDDLTSGDTYDSARIHVGVDDNNDATVWYNYAAASAGTITGSSNSTDATQDICPKGWKLPTNLQFSNITSYKNAFSPVYGGYYYNGSLTSASTRGYWWSATASNNTNRYNLGYDSGSLNTRNYNRYLGYYVRCVSSVSAPVKTSLTATATASNKTYDGNTSASVSITFKNGSTTVNLTKDTDYTIDSAVFTNASAGTNKTVTIKLTLKGNAASNYDFSGSNTTTITTTATINKASSPTTVSELTANLKTTTGVKLSTVALTTPGLSWTSPNTTVQSGSHTYSATYIKNDDSTNYNSVTINIPIEGVDETTPDRENEEGSSAVPDTGRFTGAAAGAVTGVIILPAILGVAYYLRRRKGTNRIKNCLK